MSGGGDNPGFTLAGDGPELVDDGVPIVAGVVVETHPGGAEVLAERLAGIEGLDIAGNDGDRRLAGVWSAPSARHLERSVNRLIRTNDDVLGVFPTFIGRTDGEVADL